MRIFGLDMSTDARAIKDRIGVVLDDGGFYDELSLGEMKRIIAPAYSRWSDEDFQRWLDHFRLDPHQKIATLSRGMRMKFALALAMSHGAELLIMDEPTSGLDPKIRRQLLRTLSTFMENGGKGVFFSTHITSDLDKIADFLVMIDDGQIIFQEDKDTLLDSHRILKGDSAALTTDTRPLFLSLEETAYGFTGLTCAAGSARRVSRRPRRAPDRRRHHARLHERRCSPCSFISCSKIFSSLKNTCSWCYSSLWLCRRFCSGAIPSSPPCWDKFSLLSSAC